MCHLKIFAILVSWCNDVSTFEACLCLSSKPMLSKSYLFEPSTFFFTLLFLREYWLLINSIQLFQMSIWYFTCNHLCLWPSSPAYWKKFGGNLSQLRKVKTRGYFAVSCPSQNMFLRSNNSNWFKERTPFGSICIMQSFGELGTSSTLGTRVNESYGKISDA